MTSDQEELLDQLKQRLEVEEFFPYQLEFFAGVQADTSPRVRACLYHRTGAGKSITSMVGMWLLGHTEVLVIAPPVTHPAWEEMGRKVGVTVQTMSHAKFRMKDTKLSRHIPIICDEFHLLGGHGGQGWKRLDTLAMHLLVPIIICSATPNYNDVERCYCILHILNPGSTSGGYIQYIYANCQTEENPFSRTPIVKGFLHYKDAEAYLAAQPKVYYVPDEVKAEVVDVQVQVPSPPDEFEVYGLNRRTGRITASLMEERHQRKFFALVDDDGFLRDEVYDELTTLVGNATTPVLLYCNTTTVAEALAQSCARHNVNYGMVTGKSTQLQKTAEIQRFKDGAYDVLIGTATLATGTDGVDKMCDTLIIVDDTDDDALRRQLMGRILPRGTDSDASGKSIYRLEV